MEASSPGARWIAMPSPRRFRTPGTILLGRYRGDYIQAFGVYFWKRFEIPCGARRLRIEVCGLGLCELYLDGRKVGDRVLDPPPTDYRRRALLTVHDIPAPAQGRHELTAAVGNGRHLPAFGGGDPKLYGRILADDGTGFRPIAMTDGTWRAGHGPIRENGLYFGEVYDARVRLRPEGWRRAVEVEGPRLETEAMPPIRVCRTIEPRTVQRPEAGRRIVDFGRNFSGWVRFAARGPAGSKLIIRHAELLADSGEINVSPNQGASAADAYVFAGRGRESHEPSFTQHGFRYAEFRGPEEVLKRIKIEGRFVHTDVAETGRFGCGSSIIKAIHANVRQGLLSNMMGLPTDCPQRDERHGWLADAHLAAEAAILNFDMAAFYRKFLRDIRDAQDSQGRIPDFVPAYPARLAPADPAWGSAYVTLAWLLYWYYGDTAVLEEHFDGLVRYVEFLARSARGHIIEGLGKYGDWCPPGSIAPKKTPLALTSTWFYAHDTMILAHIAARLGRKADAAKLRKRAAAITTAFNKRFLRDGQYEVPRSSPIDHFAGQTSNALPLWLGMVPSEAKTRVFSALIKAVTEDQDFHLDTGILGTRYLLEALSRGGRGDAAFRIVSQTSYPGWGYMIREGATTLWERWEKITSGGMNSHNHVMLASVDAWLYKFLAGIRCTAPGWRRAVIEPPDLEGCRSARASVAAGGGTLAAAWTRRKEEFTVDVRVPAGTQAEVRIPLLSARSVVEDEKGLVWDSRRNKPGRAGAGAIRRGDRLVLTLQGESCRFRVNK